MERCPEESKKFYSSIDVARMYGVDAKTVVRWDAKFRALGVEVQTTSRGSRRYERESFDRFWDDYQKQKAQEDLDG